MKRDITELIIHCTATPTGRECSLSEVEYWHRLQGMKCIGYHYLIHLDGTVDTGRPLDMVGAHCKGHNAKSIGIAYVGGTDKYDKPMDTRTPAQCEALRKLVADLLQQFPKATVHGHNEFSDKQCPCFDVSTEL